MVFLRLNGRYVVAFLALTILCGTSHEFAHHFVGAAMCGCFGVKTFNSFELCASCKGNVPAFFVSTWVGPLLTFGLMWLGAWRMRSGSPAQQRLGFALVFANFPINRLLFVVLGWNDEQYVTRKLFGDTQAGYWLTVLVVWALAVPPLVIAYRAVANRWRVLWFIGFFILPFVFVIVFAGFFLEEWLLLKQQFLATPVLGIPLLIVAVEVISLVLYLAFRDGIAREPVRT
jgi:hypothetical protein